MYVTVLTGTAGLLLMLAFYRNSLADLLAVRNDRVGQRNLYAKLILQLGAQNVQMNIARAGDQVLLGFRVELGIEGRILVVQTSKTGGDLLLNALYLRRDCLRVARRRNLDRLKLNLANAHRKRIAGLGGKSISHSIAAIELDDISRIRLQGLRIRKLPPRLSYALIRTRLSIVFPYHKASVAARQLDF